MSWVINQQLFIYPASFSSKQWADLLLIESNQTITVQQLRVLHDEIIFLKNNQIIKIHWESPRLLLNFGVQNKSPAPIEKEEEYIAKIQKQNTHNENVSCSGNKCHTAFHAASNNQQ